MEIPSVSLVRDKTRAAKDKVAAADAAKKAAAQQELEEKIDKEAKAVIDLISRRFPDDVIRVADSGDSSIVYHFGGFLIDTLLSNKVNNLVLQLRGKGYTVDVDVRDEDLGKESPHYRGQIKAHRSITISW